MARWTVHGVPCRAASWHVPPCTVERASLRIAPRVLYMLLHVACAFYNEWWDLLGSHLVWQHPPSQVRTGPGQQAPPTPETLRPSSTCDPFGLPSVLRAPSSVCSKAAPFQGSEPEKERYGGG